MVEIVPVHPTKLDLAWPTVEPWIQEALKYGPQLYTTDSIKKLLIEKKMFLWVAITDGKDIIGTGITSISDYPLARVLDIHWIGSPKGKGVLWLRQFFKIMKEWAKQNDCTKLGGGGRRGWVKMFGFKEVGVMIEYNL